MGIVARIIGWVWRRFADYNTLVALLDLIDAKTIVPIAIAWVGMMFFGATNTEWSAPGVVVAACIVGACVGIIVIAARSIIGRGRRGQQAIGHFILASPTSEDVGPDIDASEAFKKLLTGSAWRDEQIRLTPDATNLIPDWLDKRLDTEIHKALVNSRLKAWGEEILPNGAVAPERPIPPDTWIKVEIMFGPTGRRTSANLKVNPPYSGKLAWVGVKFSKAQFFQLFTLGGSSEWKPIYLAIKHISEIIGDIDREKCFPLARRDLRQAAYDGDVRVRGRKQLPLANPFGKDDFDEISTDIDRQYWSLSQMAPLTTGAEAQAMSHTLPLTAFSWGSKGIYERNQYAQLLVSWADIIKIWPGGVDPGKKFVARQLDDLYAEGVGKRNRLMPTIPGFDCDKEKEIFTEWDNRVLAVLDSEHVTVAEKSPFRTLNVFNPVSAIDADKSFEQHHFEAMWTEKLRRLRPIIDRVGQ